MDGGLTPLDYNPQYPSYQTQLRDEPTDVTPRFSLPIDDNDLYQLVQQKRRAAQEAAILLN
jgi:hypothetical protein